MARGVRHSDDNQSKCQCALWLSRYCTMNGCFQTVGNSSACHAVGICQVTGHLVSDEEFVNLLYAVKFYDEFLVVHVVVNL